MPSGREITAPPPVPLLLTVRSCPSEKVAVTVRSSVIVTVQARKPVQAPDHPANAQPTPGCAVRVTLVPPANEAAQWAPQSMPPGLEVTVPVPAPSLITVRTLPPVNVAVTDRSSVMVIAQVPVPLQAPDHPANVDPGAATATSWNALPFFSRTEH
jgi:hypothetical protein